MNTDNLTIEELDSRITHFENRLMDVMITEDQVEFIREMLGDLKSAKARSLPILFKLNFSISANKKK